MVAAVHEHRRKARLSQEALAFEAAVHPTYISLLERGERNPTVLVLGDIVTALGTTMTSITREVEGHG